MEGKLNTPGHGTREIRAHRFAAMVVRREPDESDGAASAVVKRSSPKQWIRWLAGIAALAAVIMVARHFSEAKDFALLAERAEPSWFVVAVILQAATYLSQGQVYRSVVIVGGRRLGLGTAYRLSLTKLFVDQAIPSGGLSGTVVLANGLERQGIPRSVVAAAIVVDIASYHALYVLSVAVALGIAGAHGAKSTIVLLGSSVFVVFSIALTVLVLVLSGRGAQAVPRTLARLRPIRTVLDFIADADPALARSPWLLLRASLYQVSILFCDVATVWVLIRALGSHGSPGGVFASFMISTVLRLVVGFLPGGLGTFEAASVVTLRMAGVPIAVALAATLLFRGLSFWLPMLPGVWLLRAEMRRSADSPIGGSRAP